MSAGVTKQCATTPSIRQAIEAAIQHLLPYAFPPDSPRSVGRVPGGVGGAEWWMQIKEAGSNDFVGMHYDKDEVRCGTPRLPLRSLAGARSSGLHTATPLHGYLRSSSLRSVG